MSADGFYYNCVNQSIYPVKICEVTSQNQCHQMNLAIAYTPKPTAMLSMIGAALIIYRFLRTKRKNRKTYDRLIFGMSWMNFFGSLGFFIGEWTFPSVIPPNVTSPFCTWQGWLLQINSAVFWYNACLATNFVLRINRGWNEDRVRHIEPFLHVIAWLYPSTTSFVALGLHQYGMAGPWCWISGTYDWVSTTAFIIFSVDEFTNERLGKICFFLRSFMVAYVLHNHLYDNYSVNSEKKR